MSSTERENRKQTKITINVHDIQTACPVLNIKDSQILLHFIRACVIALVRVNVRVVGSPRGKRQVTVISREFSSHVNAIRVTCDACIRKYICNRKEGKKQK